MSFFIRVAVIVFLFTAIETQSKTTTYPGCCKLLTQCNFNVPDDYGEQAWVAATHMKRLALALQAYMIKTW